MSEQFGPVKETLEKCLVWLTEAYSEPYQSCETKSFAKIFNAKIFAKRSGILDVWHGSEYASG